MSQVEFASFFDATWARTVACAYAVTGDLAAAEDVAQDAYSRAWARWRKLEMYEDPAAWVRRVAVNQAVSGWRRARTASRHAVRQARPDPHPAPDENTVALVRALRELPEAQRRALVFHHLAGLPVAEVARVEGCPTGTIKARLSRGRVALAELLRDDRTENETTTEESRHA